MATIRGGDRLHAALQGMAKRLSTPGTLRVGFLENATYPNGTPVALIAALNEYGAPSRGQPPRPFFRNMIAYKSPEWPDALAKNLKTNDYDVEKTLRQAGEAIKGQLQDSIRNFTSPPLAASTVERKGFDKPLIDTGHMLNSVDYDVTTS